MPKKNNDFCSLEINELTTLYEKEFEHLKAMLIKADNWSKIRIQQEVVSKLSSALHQKLFPVSGALHPAEHNHIDRSVNY